MPDLATFDARPLLEVRGLCRSFGGLRAVHQVDLDVPAGGIIGLVGPNGAGKTTCFAMIAGFLAADAGSVVFEGADITGEPPHRTALRGMVRTFQITQPFAGLSVVQNVMVGAYLRHPARADAEAHARDVATRLGLGAFLDRPADSLTVAMRKRLELARALATGPKLLLLDEVMAGLNPAEILEIVGLVRGIRDQGVSILMIEHVMQAVMALAETVHVLNQGSVIARGTPREIAADKAVVEAYLGRGAAARMARG
ncbi:MAG: ABC transporter ATP-binding protein [Acetobacteraceae bacterium]|nr:ABC transporter ATP-binding protein [Acetobacteraceae bacterium]